ncbi:MAG: UvrD-helicase domain-containing protein [Bacteroidales bacterium]|nr:UvrD-helicase domain-containing protein [Bacteroidales bacterium]
MTDKVNTILEELNDEQKRAVSCVDGPVLIVAGAGSGKTRVLTSRVAYILATQPDARILALTFTKKAAGEMKERIALMVGDKSVRRVVMGTFHAVFVRFLREFAASLGYPENFTIYDTSDSQSAVKACLKEMGLDDKIYKPREVLSRISMAKNNLITVTAYRASQELQMQDYHTKRPRLGEVYERYQQKLKQSGVMDFDDILLNMNFLLRDNPAALEAIAGRFSHIMVDEYQDTNQAQYLILRKLAQFRRNICVVGDDSQSIYAFRGARIENILNFKKDYPECKLFRLERNYRSTQVIVDAANSLIAHNEGRIPKECYAVGEDGEPIKLLKAYTEMEEAVMIVSGIMDRMRSERAQYQDFAILYRTNSQSRALEEQLRRRNIPYMIYSGNSFFERAEVKDMMAYFKLVVNPRDDESFRRVVNKPARGIGDKALGAVEAVALQQGWPLFEAAREVPKVRPFCEMIAKLSALVPTTDAHTLALKIAEESGLYAFYKLDTSVEGMSRLANLDELLNSVAQFIEEREEEAEDYVAEGGEMETVRLDDFLENVSLLSNVDVSDDEDTNNKVALMTVHSSKGLEFPYVFVAGMEENLFPSVSMLSARSEVEEERRLFYVAMTRAKKAVALSFAGTRMRHGKHESNAPSRFLKEIDPRYIENPLDEADFDNSGVTHEWGGFGSRFTGGRLERFGVGGGNRIGNGTVRGAAGLPPGWFGLRPHPSQADTWAPPVHEATGGYASRRQSSASVSGSSGRPGTGAWAPQAKRSAAIPLEGAQGVKSAASALADADFVGVPMTELSVGQRIEHNRFGPGTILELSGRAPEMKARIRFDAHGEKLLLLKYAKLRPID